MLTQKYVLRILVDASARYKDGSIKLDKDGNELRGQVNMFLSQKYEDGLSATKREAHVFTSLREAIRARDAARKAPGSLGAVLVFTDGEPGPRLGYTELSQ